MHNSTHFAWLHYTMELFALQVNFVINYYDTRERARESFFNAYMVADFLPAKTFSTRTYLLIFNFNADLPPCFCLKVNFFIFIFKSALAEYFFLHFLQEMLIKIREGDGSV